MCIGSHLLKQGGRSFCLLFSLFYNSGVPFLLRGFLNDPYTVIFLSFIFLFQAIIVEYMIRNVDVFFDKNLASAAIAYYPEQKTQQQQQQSQQQQGQNVSSAKTHVTATGMGKSGYLILHCIIYKVETFDTVISFQPRYAETHQI